MEPVPSVDPEPAPDGAAASATAIAPRPGRALGVTAGVTALVTALSWGVPSYSGTLVGIAFFGAAYALVLRHDVATIRAYGLSLGGLLEPRALEAPRLVRAAAVALGWALAFGLVVLPLYGLAFGRWVRIDHPFVFRWPSELGDRVLGQVLVTALPEEAFFRGYLQSELDAAWAPRWRIGGASVGPGLVVASALFAVGHLLTIPEPARLAVFFPSLLFGWLRARTGGIGASVVFHASCNLASAFLFAGYKNG